jgi:hypothetical protein
MAGKPRLKQISEKSDVDEITRARAHFLYAVHLELDNQNDATTVDIYRSVVSNPFTDPYTRHMALYFLAEMERDGRGIGDTEHEKAFQSAHDRYKTIIGSGTTHPLLRSIAVMSRAEMLERGHGVEKPNPDMAKILRNSAHDIVQRFLRANSLRN